MKPLLWWCDNALLLAGFLGWLSTHWMLTAVRERQRP